MPLTELASIRQKGVMDSKQTSKLPQLWWWQKGGVCLAEEAHYYRVLFVLCVDRYGDSVSSIMCICIVVWIYISLWTHIGALFLLLFLVCEV